MAAVGFLGAFLLAVAALYTGYLKEFFIPKYTEVEIQTMQETNGTHTANKLLTQHKKDSADTLVLHDTPLFGLIPIAITLLGLAFSVLWITMAKGSKAWYELYESNIAAISKNEKFWEGAGNHKNTALTNCFDKKQGYYSAYLFGNLENRAEPDAIRSIQNCFLFQKSIR